MYIRYNKALAVLRAAFTAKYDRKGKYAYRKADQVLSEIFHNSYFDDTSGI